MWPTIAKVCFFPQKWRISKYLPGWWPLSFGIPMCVFSRSALLSNQQNGVICIWYINIDEHKSLTNTIRIRVGFIHQNFASRASLRSQLWIMMWTVFVAAESQIHMDQLDWRKRNKKCEEKQNWVWTRTVINSIQSLALAMGFDGGTTSPANSRGFHVMACALTFSLSIFFHQSKAETSIVWKLERGNSK